MTFFLFQIIFLMLFFLFLNNSLDAVFPVVELVIFFVEASFVVFVEPTGCSILTGLSVATVVSSLVGVVVLVAVFVGVSVLVVGVPVFVFSVFTGVSSF